MWKHDSLWWLVIRERPKWELIYVNLYYIVIYRLLMSVLLPLANKWSLLSCSQFQNGSGATAHFTTRVNLFLFYQMTPLTSHSCFPYGVPPFYTLLIWLDTSSLHRASPMHSDTNKVNHLDYSCFILPPLISTGLRRDARFPLLFPPGPLSLSLAIKPWLGACVMASLLPCFCPTFPGSVCLVWLSVLFISVRVSEIQLLFRRVF